MKLLNIRFEVLVIIPGSHYRFNMIQRMPHLYIINCHINCGFNGLKSNGLHQVTQYLPNSRKVTYQNRNQIDQDGDVTSEKFLVFFLRIISSLQIGWRMVVFYLIDLRVVFINFLRELSVTGISGVADLGSIRSSTVETQRLEKNSHLRHLTRLGLELGSFSHFFSLYITLHSSDFSLTFFPFNFFLVPLSQRLPVLSHHMTPQLR